jgi:hypothetical protein
MLREPPRTTEERKKYEPVFLMPLRHRASSTSGVITASFLSVLKLVKKVSAFWMKHLVKP